MLNVALATFAIGMISSTSVLAMPSKEDCRALQKSLLDISLKMDGLHSDVRYGTEGSWLGSLTGAEREAIQKVQSTRIALAQAVEAYAMAAQDAAVAITVCTK